MKARRKRQITEACNDSWQIILNPPISVAEDYPPEKALIDKAGVRYVVGNAIEKDASLIRKSDAGIRLPVKALNRFTI